MGYPCVTLPVEHWPVSDRLLWQQVNCSDDLLDEDGRAAHWTEKTRRQVAKDYGRFLFWLAAQDALDPQATPGARLTRARLEDYLTHLQATGMASISLLSRLRGLRQAISVLDPTANRADLATACRRQKALAKPRRQKHLQLVDPPEIMHAALAHYDMLVADNPTLPSRVCVHARDALMLALLAHRPLRLGNFAGLRLGESLIRTAIGARLAVRACDTKEKRPYDATAPEDLLPTLDHYLAEIRPRLLGGQCSDRLWISMRGTPMSESAIYYQIIKISRCVLGQRINPHFARDCVMTFLAINAPDKVRAGARILGHRSLATSEAHYNHATSVTAQRRHLEVLATLRQRTRRLIT